MKRFLLAQVWAFFLTLPQLALFTDASNRYLLFWDRWSAPLHLGCVVLLGVVIWPLFRFRWTTPLLAGLMLAGEARGLLELASGWPRYALAEPLLAPTFDGPRVVERRLIRLRRRVLGIRWSPLGIAHRPGHRP